MTTTSIDISVENVVASSTKDHDNDKMSHHLNQNRVGSNNLDFLVDTFRKDYVNLLSEPVNFYAKDIVVSLV